MLEQGFWLAPLMVGGFTSYWIAFRPTWSKGTWLDHGRMALEQGRGREALWAARRAIALGETTGQAHNLQAGAHAELQHNKKAVRAFQQADDLLGTPQEVAGNAYLAARFCALAGMRSSAGEWLAKAALADEGYMVMAAGDLAFDGVATSSEFLQASGLAVEGMLVRA